MSAVKFHQKCYGPPICGTFVIGQNPGKQRDGMKTNVVWEGNRSGDFITKIIDDFELSGVYLTNVCNYQEMTEERVHEGLDELSEEINALKPKRVICLGKHAELAMKTLNVTDRLMYNSFTVYVMKHPSFILRFNHDKEDYAQKFVKAVRGEL